MPYKYNAGKRHHIPRARFTVTNWSEYENGLRQRGSLPLWITPEAIAKWKAADRISPGGQPRYSDLAIQACLMASVFRLMNLSLAVPDHTTISRRAAVLPPLPHIPSEGALHILIDSTGLKVYGASQ